MTGGRRAPSSDRPGVRSDSGTVRATRDYGPDPDPARRPGPRDEPPMATPRPSVVRTIGPTTARVHVIEPSGFADAPEVGDRLKPTSR